MDQHGSSPDSARGLTRRAVVRRAAYTAPAVVAIAAAPHAALAGSGPTKFPPGGGGNPGGGGGHTGGGGGHTGGGGGKPGGGGGHTGGGGSSSGGGGSTGGTTHTVTVQRTSGTNAVIVSQLPSTGTGTASSKPTIPLALMSLATAGAGLLARRTRLTPARDGATSAGNGEPEGNEPNP